MTQTLPVRINLFGGAGIGKSVTAAQLFANLKCAGVLKLELVQEWIKGWAWEKKVPDSYDQLYVFAKQLRAEHRLLKNGISVITDSPLHMQVPYLLRSSEQDATSLAGALIRTAHIFDRRYPYFNVLLKRSVPYDANGRYEDEAGARNMDVAIENHLKCIDVPYLTLDPVKDYTQLVTVVYKLFHPQS